MLAFDSIILFIFSYLLATVEECPWDLTVFQKIVIALAMVLAYNCLIRVKVIGGILIVAYSAGVTWLILQFVPLMKWVSGSKTWYYSLVFVLFVFLILLHGNYIADSFRLSSYTFYRSKKSKIDIGNSSFFEGGEAFEEDAQARDEDETAGQEKEASVVNPSFFVGCSSEEEIKKRLRTLTKTFHPDNAEGDEDTYKQILAEYENLKGSFNA